MIDETLPWLTFPPAVDLSNTIVVTSRGDIDLLTTDAQLDVWIAAEHGRIASVDAAAGHLEEVRALRADLRALLYAYAQGRPLPGPPRRRVNALSAADPTYPVLTPDGGITVKHDSRDAYTIFAAEVARSPRSNCSPATTPASRCAPRLAAGSSTRPTTHASAGAAAHAATAPG